MSICFNISRRIMKQIKIIMILFFFQILNLIYGKDCFTLSNNSTSIICSDINSTYTNITQLSLINSYLTEMPDLYNNNIQLKILHLDNNQIQLITRNYSTIEYLYLTSNHIYALHLNNLSYPKLKLLDLSNNPIEHIIENFFSYQQFPQLEILKLTNALKHINPYLIDNRLISFSSLIYLNEIDFNENNFEEFSCSNNISFIQWKLSINIKKLSFRNNKLISFDENCFKQILNLTELDLHSNNLKIISNSNLTFSYLTKLYLDKNLFLNIPTNFLHTSKQLLELNLSSNQLNLKEIQTNLFPSTIQNLYLNSMTSDLSCGIFENLLQLEQLHLEDLKTTRLENCLFKTLPKLKMLNLRNHHLKIFDEQVFRSLLSMDSFHKLDITSSSLLCDSCSLRWVIDVLKSQNKTEITCLDQYGKEVLLNTLNLPSCTSFHVFSTMIITISILISLLLSAMLCIYTYQHRKFPFSKFSSVYHMIPLRNYDRIYQSTTDDITNDNVMLVT